MSIKNLKSISELTSISDLSAMLESTSQPEVYIEVSMQDSENKQFYSYKLSFKQFFDYMMNKLIEKTSGYLKLNSPDTQTVKSKVVFEDIETAVINDLTCKKTINGNAKSANWS